MRHLKFILGLSLLLLALNVHSQKGSEIGGHIGTSVYFGDLNTNYNISSPGLSFGFLLRRNFNERLSIAGGVNYGRVSADDSNSNNFIERTRNLSFFSDIFDFNFVGEFNFFPYLHGSKDYFYTPYLFAGFSVIKFNPKARLDDQQVYTLRDFGTEGQLSGQEYGLFTGSFVFGFGLKWDINRDWSINASLSGRNLFSDYVDDVSTTYPNFANLEARRGPLAVQLSDRSGDSGFAMTDRQRGNAKNNDLIYFVHIGIMKYFGELPCPAISKDIF